MSWQAKRKCADAMRTTSMPSLHPSVEAKKWGHLMLKGGESVEVEIQKNVYGAALLAIAQVSVAGTRLEQDGIMIAWFLPFKIHHKERYAYHMSSTLKYPDEVEIFEYQSLSNIPNYRDSHMLIVWLPLFKHALQMPSGQELCEWEWQTSGGGLPSTSCSSVMLNS